MNSFNFNLYSNGELIKKLLQTLTEEEQNEYFESVRLAEEKKAKHRENCRKYMQEKRANNPELREKNRLYLLKRLNDNPEIRERQRVYAREKYRQGKDIQKN